MPRSFWPSTLPSWRISISCGGPPDQSFSKKSVTRFFQTKIIPPSLWNACDFVLQYNFKIAHVPGRMNTAADFLSRLDISPREKVLLQIREDIQTTPIQVNIQSSNIHEEDQFYFFRKTTPRQKKYLGAKTKSTQENIQPPRTPN